MSTEESNDKKYARHLAIKVKPEQIDNFLAKMRDDIYPSLKKQTGIRRVYLLRSYGGGNEFVSETLWDNKYFADTYGASNSFKENIESVRNFIESDPSVTEFDIILHDLNTTDLPLPEKAKQTIRKSPASRNSKRAKQSKKRAKKSKGKK